MKEQVVGEKENFTMKLKPLQHNVEVALVVSLFVKKETVTKKQ